MSTLAGIAPPNCTGCFRPLSYHILAPSVVWLRRDARTSAGTWVRMAFPLWDSSVGTGEFDSRKMFTAGPAWRDGSDS